MIARTMRVKDLAKILREEIESSSLPPDSPIMSARELAEKYGSSTLTANRALSSLEDEGLIYRVRGSGSFVAGNDKNTKSLKIGIAFPIPQGDKESVEAAFAVYPRSITESLRAMGHESINISYYDLLDPRYVEENLSRLDGLILSRSCIDNKTFPLLEKANSNIVTVQNEGVSHYSCHQVVPDLRVGFKDALLHLAEKDCPKIYIASCNPEEHHKYRISLLYRVAEELKISSSRMELITSKRQIGDLGRMSGQEMGRKLIDKTKPFAVFSLSDFTSFGILDVVMEQKLELGKEVSIVSFDNLEGYGLLPFRRPIVSTITNPKEKITGEAIKILLSRIDKNDGFTHISRVPTEFIPRRSSTGKD
jgi:DNA-binding LacI/PurR family transcriptional regulator